MIEEANNASVPVVAQSITASGSRLPPLPKKTRAHDDSPLGIANYERPTENLCDGGSDQINMADIEEQKNEA